jgi:Tfp pilus assembly protein PilZ
MEVSGQMTSTSEVSLIDIGMGGLSLSADRRLNIGGTYMLKLECQKKVVSVMCQVTWARISGRKTLADGEAVPLYTAGMKFVGLSAECAASLLSLVEHVGRKETARNDDRRAHVRFQIGSPGTARLSFPADYRVRTISLCGMLIETAVAFESESTVPMVLSLRDDRSIEFLGRVVSCQPTEGAGRDSYSIGIEFIDVADEAKEMLAAFIALLPPPERAG